MAEPLPFRVPDLKKLVKAAQDMGLPVTGIVVGPDGSIHIKTMDAKENEADATLERWMRNNG
ncbi:hypothetical protein [Paenirhodobacter hankyongi]|uniref:Uncharacterized protein n=1 Tax=Paenirhodobacter hankyongi TaxID=2294033 RepID=A0A421BQN4_9RHOB|nr:hypothetical protein [Sinirhodobacter hankyongi]RLL65265.1 hypothetical protein DYS74_08045 [Sinirhodobacter hankyongi]